MGGALKVKNGGVKRLGKAVQANRAGFRALSPARARKRGFERAYDQDQLAKSVDRWLDKRHAPAMQLASRQYGRILWPKCKHMGQDGGIRPVRHCAWNGTPLCE
jgi:hypothetical protein